MLVLLLIVPTRRQTTATLNWELTRTDGQWLVESATYIITDPYYYHNFFFQSLVSVLQHSSILQHLNSS